MKNYMLHLHGHSFIVRHVSVISPPLLFQNRSSIFFEVISQVSYEKVPLLISRAVGQCPLPKEIASVFCVVLFKVYGMVADELVDPWNLRCVV